jgi:hypothetical protein
VASPFRHPHSCPDGGGRNRKHLFGGRVLQYMDGNQKAGVLKKLAVPSADHTVRVLPDGIYIKRKSQGREAHERFQRIVRMAFEHDGEGYTISDPQTNKQYGGYAHLLLLRVAPASKAANNE